MKSSSVEIQKVKPKMIAQRCPVCNGFGSLKYGRIKCHGCQGKGWVTIPVEDERGEI